MNHRLNVRTIMAVVAGFALVFWAATEDALAILTIGLSMPPFFAWLTIKFMNRRLPGCDLRNDYSIRAVILVTLVYGTLVWPCVLFLWACSQL